MTSGIYCIQHRESGRCYFGSSVNVEKRICQHKSDLSCNRHHNIFLQRAANKYGIDTFDFFLVIEVPEQDLLEVEQTFLDENCGGFNLAPAAGGDILSNHPNRLEIIQRMTISVRERFADMSEDERKEKYGKSGPRNGMYGRTHTDDVKNEQSRRAKEWYKENGSPLKGKPLSQERREKLSAFAKTRTGAKNPFFGRTHSDETKRKLSEKNKQNSPMKGIDPALLSFTKTYRITYPDGSTEIFVGLKEIAEKYGVSRANVQQFIKRGKVGIRGKFIGLTIETMEKP